VIAISSRPSAVPRHSADRSEQELASACRQARCLSIIDFFTVTDSSRGTGDSKLSSQGSRASLRQALAQCFLPAADDVEVVEDAAQLERAADARQRPHL
jgi:hypothetical protein